jgi:hypothetical protein
VRDGDGEQAVLPDRHGVHHRQRAHQALRVHYGEEVCPNPGPQCGDCKLFFMPKRCGFSRFSIRKKVSRDSSVSLKLFNGTGPAQEWQAVFNVFFQWLL